jgi:hypothetical protein
MMFRELIVAALGLYGESSLEVKSWQKLTFQVL